MPGATPWDTSKGDDGGSGAAGTPADDIGAAGLRKGVIHTPEQEAGVREKAASGGVITNADMDPRTYLGHFGNENIMKKGHNVVGEKKGAQVAQVTAKKGFRKLPGSASPQQGRARYGTMSESDLGLRPPRFQREIDAKLKAKMSRSMGKTAMQIDPMPLKSIAAPFTAVNKGGGTMPPTTANKKMSIKHETERIAFNMKHASDHTRDAQEARRKLAQIKKMKPPKA